VRNKTPAADEKGEEDSATKEKKKDSKEKGHKMGNCTRRLKREGLLI